jgi:hypothetical protein
MRVEGPKSDSKAEDNAYGYMAFNMRATNDYANVRAMAYLVNVFPNKDIKDYFNEQGVETSDDLLAVSTLVQWLWRGCIRKDKPEPLYVYVPSERMRGLFREWLAADSTKEFVDRKMEGARQELAIVKAGGRPKRLKSTEVGFEESVITKPLAIAAE